MNRSNSAYCHLKPKDAISTAKTICGLDDPGVYSYQGVDVADYPKIVSGVIRNDDPYPYCPNCKLVLYRLFQETPTDVVPETASPSTVAVRKSMRVEPNGLPESYRETLNAILRSYTRAFRLRWRGTKIPRGASIDGDPISWTQHGFVYGTTSTMHLGYYGRMEEFSGENGDEHEMIIATDGDVAAGPGQTVEQIYSALPLTITAV